MRNLILLAAALNLVTAMVGCKNAEPRRSTAKPGSPPVFQLRLVSDAPSADSEPMTLRPGGNTRTQSEVLNVKKTVLLDETALSSASSGTDPLGGTVIEINFTKDGGKRFAEITRQNIGQRLAIVIDGQLCQAPTVRMEIAGGTAQISGAFSKAEAGNLAAKINQSLRK